MNNIRDELVKQADHLSAHYTVPMLRKAVEDIDELKQWVQDLQSGMYINCVYCGHRYGPNSDVGTGTIAQALTEHIERCPEHPMSVLKASLRQAEESIEKMRPLILLCSQQESMIAELTAKIQLNSGYFPSVPAAGPQCTCGTTTRCEVPGHWSIG